MMVVCRRRSGAVRGRATCCHGRIERSVPVIFSMSGETFDVGRDTGSPVGNYPHDFAFCGTIRGVTWSGLPNQRKR